VHDSGLGIGYVVHESNSMHCSRRRISMNRPETDRIRTLQRIPRSVRHRPLFCLSGTAVVSRAGTRRARSGRGVFLHLTAGRVRIGRGRLREPSGPQRSGGRGLARSGPPATIEGPEGKSTSGTRSGAVPVAPQCRPAGYGIDVSLSAYVSADRLRINPSAVLAAEK
jgi:hypothetical protein